MFAENGHKSPNKFDSSFPRITEQIKLFQRNPKLTYRALKSTLDILKQRLKAFEGKRSLGAPDCVHHKINLKGPIIPFMQGARQTCIFDDDESQYPNQRAASTPTVQTIEPFLYTRQRLKLQTYGVETAKSRVTFFFFNCLDQKFQMHEGCSNA